MNSTFASQPHRASTRVVLAELGSLSVEFTRLAQITKEAKYYDAVARITIEFEKWQNYTKMPGLWPQKVDASGCKKEEVPSMSPIEHSRQKGPGVSELLPQGGEISKPSVGASSLESEGDVSKEATSQTKLTKRQSADDALRVLSTKPDCVPQGLASPPYSSTETFTLGGQADSVYEYLPKEYMLLGGLESRYQRMYEMSTETTKKYLLFRPMIEDEKRDVLFSGQVTTQGHLDDKDETQLKAEGTHLTCFVGGMFAIGAKIFDRSHDLELAWKLTDGCVWAYESTATGIMPEHFIALPCESREKCPWNETAYWEALDPYRSTRVPSTPATQTVLGDPKGDVSEDKAAISGDLPATDDLGQGTKAPSVAQDVVSEEDTESASAAKLDKRQLGDLGIEESAESASNDSGVKASDVVVAEIKASRAAGSVEDRVVSSGNPPTEH